MTLTTLAGRKHLPAEAGDHFPVRFIYPVKWDLPMTDLIDKTLLAKTAAHFPKTATHSAGPVTQSALRNDYIYSHPIMQTEPWLSQQPTWLFPQNSFRTTLFAKLFPQSAWNQIQKIQGSILPTWPRRSGGRGAAFTPLRPGYGLNSPWLRPGLG